MIPVLRRLGRAPGFVITTVASLALAVGANTAIFSIVNALWLRPLPVHEPEQLVVPYYPVVHSSDGELLDDVRLPAARQLSALSGFEAVTFELNAATRLGDWRPVLRATPDAAPYRTFVVASNYFSVLGVPIEGRAFTEDEERRGADPVAVVSRAFWKRLAGGQPFAAGRAVPASDGPIPIVGVAPAEFQGARLGDAVDLWIPMGALPRLSELAAAPGIEPLTPVTVFARLRDGISIERAQDEARSVLNPKTTLRPLREIAFPLRSEGSLVRQRSLVQMLWLAAALVLVLGCSNLAALFTARAAAARQELAIRLSLGSRRSQLVAMVLAEAAVLAGVGLAAGLLFRVWLLRGISALETSAGVAVSSLDTSVDARVLTFGLLTTLVAVSIAAGGAAMQARKTNLHVLISSASAGGTRGQRRLRQCLLATHAALAVTLLVAAVTLAATVYRAFDSGKTFARPDLVLASVRPRFTQYMGKQDDAPRRSREYAAVIDRLRRQPFVLSATHGDPPIRPLREVEEIQLRVDGRDVSTPLLRLRGGEGYVSAIGAPIVQGREFTEQDIRASVSPREMMRHIALRRLPGFRESVPNAGRAAVVIDEALAELLWPGEQALGQTFIWRSLDISYLVVGVVSSLGRHPRAHVVPALIAPQSVAAFDGLQPLTLVIRVQGDGREHLPAVAALLREAFPDAPILQVTTAYGQLQVELAQERMGARIFTYYAIVSLLLVLAGLHGLLLFLAAQSRKDFAIRFALGASERSLRALALLRVLVPVGVGAAAGFLLAHALGSVMAARFVGLDRIPAAISLPTGLAFCALTAVTGMWTARRIQAINAAEILRGQ